MNRPLIFRLPDVDSLFKLNLIYFFIDIISLFLFLSFFLSFFIYLFTVNPLSSPRGGLFISSPFKGRGAYLREGAYLIERTMAVSVLHKEVEYGVEKLQYRKF